MELSFVEKIIVDRAKEDRAVFVFPTGISSQLWLERYLEIIGEGSCAVEQFIAWDMFKSGAVRSKIQDLKSIPSVLRKLFVAMLVAENSDLIHANKPPLFTGLILPEYESSASSFVKWLTTILPGLASWEEKISGKQDDEDAEDRDLRMLNTRYKEFLAQHKLFEPAWEKPPFESSGNHYYIFFPEIISDFHEYENLLNQSNDITIVHVPQTSNDCWTILTEESRNEIKSASLFIRKLAETIPWENIAVSVADMERYKPYLLREFSLRNIPFTFRAGKKLSDYRTGKLFSQIAACASLGFSFSHLAELLLNKSLPWNNPALISQLLDFGIKNNCVASWSENEKQIDVWEITFKSPCGQNEQLCFAFYRQLKKAVLALCNAKSFSEIRAHYFAFKKTFFSEDFLPESDLVLSRCIKELLVLVELEETYPDVKPPNPFSFFIERLTEIDYLAQQDARGVSVFPYKVATSAPFAAHIVIGAHQDALSTVFQQMKFLNRSKRDILGIIERDATDHFIRLYKLNSMAHNAAFFCAKHTFSGYISPHPMFHEANNPRIDYAEDCFETERNALKNAALNGEDCLPREQPAPSALLQMGQTLYSSQEKSFEAWRKNADSDRVEDESIFNQPVTAKIEQKYSEARFDGKYRVSASLLKDYYECGLQWVYNSILNIREISTDASIMEPAVTGNVYHVVLKDFFDSLIAGNNRVLLSPDENSKLPKTYADLLRASTEKIFSRLPALSGSSGYLSPLTVTLLKECKQGVEQSLSSFLAGLLDLFAGCAINAAEKEFITDVNSDIFFKGFIDCILISPDKNTVLIDFKKSAMPKREACVSDKPEDFQLSLYTLLAEANNYPQVSTALFMSILEKDKRIILGSVFSAAKNKSYPQQNLIIERASPQAEIILKTAREYAENFANEIKKGECSTVSANFSRCFGCEFREVCRKTYDAAKNTRKKEHYV